MQIPSTPYSPCRYEGVCFLGSLVLSCQAYRRSQPVHAFWVEGLPEDCAGVRNMVPVNFIWIPHSQDQFPDQFHHFEVSRTDVVELATSYDQLLCRQELPMVVNHGGDIPDLDDAVQLHSEQRKNELLI